MTLFAGRHFYVRYVTSVLDKRAGRAKSCHGSTSGTAGDLKRFGSKCESSSKPTPAASGCTNKQQLRIYSLLFAEVSKQLLAGRHAL